MKINKAGAIGVGAVVTSLAALFAVFHDKFSYTHEPMKVLSAERMPQAESQRTDVSVARKSGVYSPAMFDVLSDSKEDLPSAENLDLKRATYYVAKARDEAMPLRDRVVYLNVVLDAINKPENANAIGMPLDSVLFLMKDIGFRFLQSVQSSGGIDAIINSEKIGELEKYNAIQDRGTEYVAHLFNYGGFIKRSKTGSVSCCICKVVFQSYFSKNYSFNRSKF